MDLPNESSGTVYSENNMHEVELATSSFGQSLTCTMVQELAAFSAVINGGYYYKPHVVGQITNSDGGVVKNVEPNFDASAHLRQKFFHASGLSGSDSK